jgi:hypothetical protein
MNHDLVSNKILIPVSSNSSVSLNVSLLENPTTHDQYVSLPFSGLFLADQNDTLGNVKYPKLPIHNDDGK